MTSTILTRRKVVTGTLLAATIVFVAGGVPPGQLLAQQAERRFRPQRVLAAQPVITDFATKAVRDVGDVLNPSELVLGVTIGKESRAYPINMLTGPSREIINDTIGGQAIAATW